MERKVTGKSGKEEWNYFKVETKSASCASILFFPQQIFSECLLFAEVLDTEDLVAYQSGSQQKENTLGS